jgi:hypothetical protein
MPRNAMVPHISGTTLSAQVRRASPLADHVQCTPSTLSYCLRMSVPPSPRRPRANLAAVGYPCRPLCAQARYAAGVREILEGYLDGKEIRKSYQIVTNGQLAGAGAHAYKAGDSTGGSK